MHTIATRPGWMPLGAVEPTSLTDARLALHHAAQVVVSAAISYLPAQADDSHTNLEWLPGHGALASHALPGEGLRFAVRVCDLTLLALDGSLAVRASLPLHGRTNGEAYAWLATELRAAGFAIGRLTTRKHYEIPAHAVAGGAPYGATDALPELARCYHDGWALATAVQEREHSSPVRCWPHHFDIATLITLPPAPAAPARTIGVGLSPGDDSCPEPYFYVGPYPRLPAAALRPLRSGRWHTAGWQGVMLTATELAAAGDAERQHERAMAYVDEAVAACRVALDALAGLS